jgi:RNA polymerase sigma factor (sigma-70 family)
VRGERTRGNDVSVAADVRVRAEFDAAYPRLVSAATGAAQRFFRFDTSQVEDAVAETMARTFERWERVRRHDNPVGWVVVCAKNVCLEQLRKNSRQAQATSAQQEDVDIFIDLSDETAVSVTISNALDQLSKRQRDVAVLRYLMDCDEKTTAEAMGTSVGKVKTAAHEARGRLRPILAGIYLDDDAVSP